MNGKTQMEIDISIVDVLNLNKHARMCIVNHEEQLLEDIIIINSVVFGWRGIIYISVTTSFFILEREADRSRPFVLQETVYGWDTKSMLNLHIKYVHYAVSTRYM